MLNFENHQPKVKYLLIALAVILIAIIYFAFYQAGRKMGKSRPAVPGANEKTESLAEEQLRQLEKLRVGQEKNLKSPEEQLKDLEAIRGEDAKPLTEEEVQKQLEELEKLRNSNQ